MELQRRLPEYTAPSHTSPNAAYFYQPDAYSSLQRRRIEPHTQQNHHFAISKQSDTFSPQAEQIHQTGVLPSSWVTELQDSRLSVSPLAKYHGPTGMLNFPTLFFYHFTALLSSLVLSSTSQIPRKSVFSQSSTQVKNAHPKRASQSTVAANGGLGSADTNLTKRGICSGFIAVIRTS